MAGRASGFAGNALHSTAITEKCKSVVVDQFESGLVEFGSCMGLRNGKADSIGEPLTEWTSRNLYTWRILSFGVAGGYAVNRLLQSTNLSMTVDKIVTMWRDLTRKAFKSSKDTP